jgi:hypothetical protein
MTRRPLDQPVALRALETSSGVSSSRAVPSAPVVSVCRTFGTPEAVSLPVPTTNRQPAPAGHPAELSVAGFTFTVCTLVRSSPAWPPVASSAVGFAFAGTSVYAGQSSFVATRVTPLEGVGDAVGLAVSVGVGVGAPVGEAEGVGVGVSKGEGEGVGDGVPVSAGGIVGAGETSPASAYPIDPDPSSDGPFEGPAAVVAATTGVPSAKARHREPATAQTVAGRT